MTRKYLKYTHTETDSFLTWTISDGKSEVEVATNLAGEGLWIGGRQVRGTSQFSLPKTREARYLRLKAIFAEYKNFD